MKYSLNLFLLFSWTLCCCSEEPTRVESSFVEVNSKLKSPIEGSWILVSNEVNGEKVIPKRHPQQLKMFHDGFFSFIMYDFSGNFYYAGAGPYEIKGNEYKETFQFSSDKLYIDSVDWQTWEIKEDTLIFYGFKKAFLANGEDVTDDWGKDKFVEKRIRANNKAAFLVH